MNKRTKNVCRNSGFILQETLMAVGLAMALTVGIAQLLVIVAQQRHLARQRAVAASEISNLMEQTLARPWDETTTRALRSVDLSDDADASLPDSDLSVEVAEEEDGSKRITVEIRWQNAPERAPESARLVGWKFPALEDGS